MNRRGLFRFFAGIPIAVTFAKSAEAVAPIPPPKMRIENGPSCHPDAFWKVGAPTGLCKHTHPILEHNHMISEPVLSSHQHTHVSWQAVCSVCGRSA